MWLQHCKPCWLDGVDVVSEIVNLAGDVVCGVNLQGYMGVNFWGNNKNSP